MTELLVVILSLIVLIWSVFIIVLLRHYDGQIIIIPGENGKKTFSLEINGDPEEIQNMKTVKFKVIKIEEIAD